MIISGSLGLLIVRAFIFLKNVFFYPQCIVSWCIVQGPTFIYHFRRFGKPSKCFAVYVIWRSLRRVAFLWHLKALPVSLCSSCAYSQWSHSSAWPLSAVPISFALSSCCCAVMLASVKGVPGEVPPSYNFHIYSHVLAAFLSIPGNMVVLLSIRVKRAWVHS